MHTVENLIIMIYVLLIGNLFTNDDMNINKTNKAIL